MLPELQQDFRPRERIYFTSVYISPNKQKGGYRLPRMEFEVHEHATLISAEGKIAHLLTKETFGPTELFMAGIGG